MAIEIDIKIKKVVTDGEMIVESNVALNRYFSFGDRTDFYTETGTGVYARRGTIQFAGTDNDIISKIEANIYKNDCDSVGIRIYDVTNTLVIAEKTGIVSTDLDNVEDLGAISNLPSDPALFEIQLIKVGAGTTPRCRMGGLVITT